jgi:hypothetical protein
MDETETSNALECTLRIAGGTLQGVVEVSIDGSEYRPCRRVDGEWRLRWEAAMSGADPVVAVIRLAPEERERA